jgi:uncharacterized protein (DUF1800 family)
MRPVRTLFPLISSAANAAVTAALCTLMVVPPAFAEGSEPVATTSVAPVVRSTKLNEHERVLQALNRLTFGPRPGDVAAVERVGLDRWFDEQLHPERIDDSALQAELAMYPASQMKNSELMRRFPPPQVLKQMASRGMPLPSDPVEHAIYADALASYEAQQKKQGAAGQQEAKAVPADKVADMADEAMMPSVVGASPETSVKKGKALKHSEAIAAMDPADAREVLALPADERYGRLLAMSGEESVAFREGLKPAQRALLTQGMTPAQTEVVLAMQGPARVVGAEAMETRLLRDIDSNRQLQAVMADFWLNHFSVYARKNQLEPYMLATYERETVLPRSLGRFEDLLVATAASPAMLMYLDNWESIGDHSLAADRVKALQERRPNGAAQKLPKGINENYGRELMELHTLGVGGGYTQKDVIEVAKCFTGWTIDRPYQGILAQQQAMGGGFGGRRGALQQVHSAPGEFLYDPNRHEPGTKVVLGHEIKEDGLNEGLEVLHLLATSPATAHFISQKLAVRFVSDDPSPALVDRMTATWLKTDGNISAVLSTMFHSPEFFSSAVYRAKVKTPIEFMVSALRASDAHVLNPLPLVQAMDRLGMPVYGMQTPNGYSWKSDEWVSSNALIARMNFSLVLAAGRLPGVRTDWPGLLGAPGDSNMAMSPTAETEKQLEGLLLDGPAAEKTRATVLAQFANPTVPQEAERGFRAQPAPQTAEIASEDGAGQVMQPTQQEAQGVMLVRAKATRAGRGGGGFEAAASAPVTPLDTMAGLLLGSPEFQRR